MSNNKQYRPVLAVERRAERLMATKNGTSHAISFSGEWQTRNSVQLPPVTWVCQAVATGLAACCSA